MYQYLTSVVPANKTLPSESIIVDQKKKPSQPLLESFSEENFKCTTKSDYYKSKCTKNQITVTLVIFLCEPFSIII